VRKREKNVIQRKRKKKNNVSSKMDVLLLSENWLKWRKDLLKIKNRIIQWKFLSETFIILYFWYEFKQNVIDWEIFVV
jgi:hypothetical protein